MKSNRKRAFRLFLQSELSRESVELNDEQAHYIRHVLRLRSGDSLTVFNGLGAEWHAVVDRLARTGSRLRLTEAAERLPESPLELSILQAVAKADAMDLIVQKSAELGVRSVSPVWTDFSVVRLDDARAARRTEHWRRIARSACEQCGRHFPPTIHAPRKLSEALAEVRADSLRVTLHPGGPDTLRTVAPATAGSSRLYLLVGPEGGLSGADLKLGDEAGFRRASLGPRILRTETATLAACTLAQALWGDLGP